MAVELVLDRSTILRLARDRAVVAEFPFLAWYARPPKAGCCPGSTQAVDTTPAVAAIMGLPPDRKARFKALTGASKVKGRVVRALKAANAEF